MKTYRLAVAILCMAGFGLSGRAQFEVEDFARWYFSPGIGFLIYEGDEPVQSSGPFDGILLNLRFGHDYNEWWSLEGGLIVAPSLKENYVGWEGVLGEREPPALKNRRVEGNTVRGERSQAHDKAAGFGRTWMGMGYADALWHFTRWERMDPYLAGGIGLMVYGEDLLPDGKNWTFVYRAGGGLMYHFNDEWAVRLDGRLLLSTYNTEFNVQADAGVVWTWGARVPPDFRAVGGPMLDDVLRIRPEPDFELYIPFEYDQAVIRPQYFPMLDEVAEALKQRPNVSARIEGHADQLRTSSARYNRRLSLRRAEAVLEYLVLQSGIERTRLSADGHGFERPKYPPNLVEGTPGNRRVDVYLLDPNTVAGGS